MAQRVRQPTPYRSVAVLVATLSIGMVVATTDSVYAEQTATITNAEAKKTIQEIIAQDEFNNKKIVKAWRNKNEKDEKEEEEEDEDESEEGSSFKLDWLGLGMASIGEAILWIIVAGLIVLAIIMYLRWSPVAASGSHKINKKLPKSLFGLEITPESLPDDVGKAAMDLWNNKDPLVALSLLYRGALTTLIHRDGINLKGSATEGDCIRTVFQHTDKLSEAAINYFNNLTKTWQFAAYAHRLPDDSMMRDLSQRWTQHFGVQS